MSKSAATVLKVLVSIALAVLILYFVFRKIDLDDFMSRTKDVNYFWVVLTMLISLMGYILRAYRWRLQLEPLGYKPSTFRMFLAVMTGYLANLVIPRLGEVARCGTLFKSDSIPVSKSFGSVVTERLVDVLVLAIILLFTFLIQSDQFLTFFDQTVNLSINWTLVGLILVVGGGIGAFVFFKWVYPSQTKLGEFSRGVIAGLISLKDVRLLPFILTTLGIWIVYFFMTYLMVFSIEETSQLNWQAGLAILAAGVIAFVLPVQSGFGTFHALVSAMLLLYGIEETTGVFFATMLHGSQLLAVLIYGLVALVLSIFVKRHGQQSQNIN